MAGHPIQVSLPGPFTCVISFRGQTVGGFPDVSSLEAAVRSVVLRRGRIHTEDFYDWIKASRYGIVQPRRVTITVFDAAGRRVGAYLLRHALPSRWTGPMLTAKGGADVAMEELVLAHEGIEPEQMMLARSALGDLQPQPPVNR